MSRDEQHALAVLDNHVQFVCPYLRDPRTIAWSVSLRVTREAAGVWVFGPAERDPLRGRTGRHVLPRSARHELRRVAAYGIPFQRIAVAHEVDPDGPVGELSGTADGPQPCSDELARRLVGAVPPPPGVTRVLRLLDRAVLSGVAVTGTAWRVLDPIVFGVLAPTTVRPGGLSLWYPLTAWRW